MSIAAMTASRATPTRSAAAPARVPASPAVPATPVKASPLSPGKPTQDAVDGTKELAKPGAASPVHVTTSAPTVGDPVEATPSSPHGAPPQDANPSDPAPTSPKRDPSAHAPVGPAAPGAPVEPDSDEIKVGTPTFEAAFENWWDLEAQGKVTMNVTTPDGVDHELVDYVPYEGGDTGVSTIDSYANFELEYEGQTYAWEVPVSATYSWWGIQSDRELGSPRPVEVVD